MVEAKWITNKHAINAIKMVCRETSINEHNHELIDKIMYIISKVVET